jgi:hypothetical protein
MERAGTLIGLGGFSVIERFDGGTTCILSIFYRSVKGSNSGADRVEGTNFAERMVGPNSKLQSTS